MFRPESLLREAIRSQTAPAFAIAPAAQAFIKSEVAKYAKVIKAARIVAN